MNFVTKGTRTSTGGVVIEGHDGVLIDGKPATSVGQKATCASGRKNCKGVGQIVSVSKNRVTLPNGMPAALAGDKVLCNCGDNVIVDPDNGVTVGEYAGGDIILGGSGISFGPGVRMGFGPGGGGGSVAKSAQSLSSSPHSVSLPSETKPSSSEEVYRPRFGNTTDYTEKEQTVQSNTSSEQADVDDTYLVFADDAISVEEFAEQVYQSSEPEIITHIHKTNPHLKRSFGTIIEGMPLVISPWKTSHPDEAYALVQANELMTEFLKLSSEEKQWFAKHHETATNAILMAATSGLDVYLANAQNEQISEFNLSHLLAGGGAVLAGAQVQGNKIGKRMSIFAGYSKYVAAQLEGLSGQALYSNPVYKEWRQRQREFQRDMKGLLSEVGRPGYIKEIQPKQINRYLNVHKRQLYKAKDFSKTISGIDMTGLYKQAMSYSRMMSASSWTVVGLGLYGNAKEIYKTCEMNGIISEACGRATTRNVVSGTLNAGIGWGIGVALAPLSGGLSIVLVSAGALAWGLYGGSVADVFSHEVEAMFFD